MEIIIKGGNEHDDQNDIKFDVDSENISMWQGDDFIMLFDETMARRMIKAIKKSAKHLGWDLS